MPYYRVRLQGERGSEATDSMILNELKNKVKKFEEKVGFDKTDVKKLLEMVDEEIGILKSNLKRPFLSF